MLVGMFGLEPCTLLADFVGTLVFPLLGPPSFFGGPGQFCTYHMYYLRGHAAENACKDAWAASARRPSWNTWIASTRQLGCVGGVSLESVAALTTPKSALLQYGAVTVQRVKYIIEQASLVIAA